MTMKNQPQSERSEQCDIRLEPWDEGDLPLLKKTLGDPAMTKYLGGPESGEQLLKRQTLYERFAESGKGRMLKIVLEATGEAVGKVGYWGTTHNGEGIYEMGWQVLPAFQGRGIAGAAVALARSDGKYQFVHAFPSVDNFPSNAICRKSGSSLRNAISSTPGAVSCAAITGVLIFLEAARQAQCEKQRREHGGEEVKYSGQGGLPEILSTSL